MKRSTLYYVIDVLMSVVFLGAVFTGALLWLFVGRGAVPTGEKYLWGLHRHDWGDIHLFFTLAFVALAAVHLVLHWNWVIAKSRHFFRLPGAVVPLVVVLATAVVLAAAYAYKTVNPGPYGPRGGGPPRREERPEGGGYRYRGGR